MTKIEQTQRREDKIIELINIFSKCKNSINEGLELFNDLYNRINTPKAVYMGEKEIIKENLVLKQYGVEYFRRFLSSSYLSDKEFKRIITNLKV